MALVDDLAAFVVRASWEDVPESARGTLKVRVLDSLGCAIGALGGEPIRMLREQLSDFGGSPVCTLIGGGRSTPDRAALYNGALVRYLDFNDSFLAKGETCHPSDNLGAVLAVAQYTKAAGKDALTALALAYQVQCRLSEVAPVRARGFDHTTQGAFAVAAGVSRVLGLDQDKTANAMAIAGTALGALRVTRTGALSHWKGLAYPHTAFAATHAAFLASHGITGPREVFEGNKGFMDTISGQFELDWSKENLDVVTRTIIKKFNAEIHSQSALETVIELRDQHKIDVEEVDSIDIETFDVAFNIIGGGEEGDKTRVTTKEEADHSLHYMVAVALLDGEVTPAQYRAERIGAPDVQSLLRRVRVRPDAELSTRFPEEHSCRVHVRLGDGTVLSKEKRDYEGFVTRPATWGMAAEKFERLSGDHVEPDAQREILDAVRHLDGVAIPDLMALLERL